MRGQPLWPQACPYVDRKSRPGAAVQAPLERPALALREGLQRQAADTEAVATIVAISSKLAIGLGTGSQTLAVVGPLAQSLFLQFYLLMLFAAALPMAALLLVHDRLVSELSEKGRLLEMSEGAANVGHWHRSRW